MWRLVKDEKLKAITQFPALSDGEYDGAVTAVSPHVFVTDPLEGAVELVQYWAECGDFEKFSANYGVPTISLCISRLGKQIN